MPPAPRQLQAGGRRAGRALRRALRRAAGGRLGDCGCPLRPGTAIAAARVRAPDLSAPRTAVQLLRRSTCRRDAAPGLRGQRISLRPGLPDTLNRADIEG
jgi:hypothetical protein